MGRKRIRSQDYFVRDSKGKTLWRNLPEDHMLYRFAVQGKKDMQLLKNPSYDYEEPKVVAYWLEDDLFVYQKEEVAASQVALIRRVEQTQSFVSHEAVVPQVTIYPADDISMPGSEIKFLLATRGL